MRILKKAKNWLGIQGNTIEINLLRKSFNTYKSNQISWKRKNKKQQQEFYNEIRLEIVNLREEVGQMLSPSDRDWLDLKDVRNKIDWLHDKQKQQRIDLEKLRKGKK